eukprot:Sspe_Gene.37557::Locus_18123_Transcript_1_1_Confidence_1.000_Length_2940::g.37557::m.37557
MGNCCGGRGTNTPQTGVKTERNGDNTGALVGKPVTDPNEQSHKDHTASMRSSQPPEQLAPGMPKNSYDRVCYWLLSIHEPSGAMLRWQDAPSSEGTIRRQIATLKNMGVSATPEAPIMRQMVREYDKHRQSQHSDSAELCAAVRDAIVSAVTTSQPLDKVFAVNWLQRLLHSYLSHDPSAAQSCVELLQFIEDDRCDEEEMMPRHLGLVVDLWKTAPELRDALQSAANACLCSRSLGGSTSSFRGVSPQPALLDLSVSMSPRAPMDRSWPLGCSESIIVPQDDETVEWECRLTAWFFSSTPPWNSITVPTDIADCGPTADLLGLELRCKAVSDVTRIIFPPRHVSPGEDVASELLSVLITGKASYSWKTPSASYRVEIDPINFQVSCSEGEKETDVKVFETEKIRITRSMDSDGFDITVECDDRDIYVFDAGSVTTRNCIVAGARLFAAIASDTIANELMGNTWKAEWRSTEGVASKLVLLTRGLSSDPHSQHFVPEDCPLRLVNAFGTLIALKHEWWSNYNSLLSRLTSSIGVSSDEVVFPEARALPYRRQLSADITRQRSASVLDSNAAIRDTADSPVPCSSPPVLKY